MVLPIVLACERLPLLVGESLRFSFLALAAFGFGCT